jgi:uncharacterized membrane protein YfcA
MLNSFPVILLVGTVLGFLSGLGVGGGSLLLLWLTVVLGADPSTARTINLLFFLPSAVIACTIRCRRGTLKIKPILPAIISGCIAAIIFTFIGSNIDLQLLKKIFGGLLICAGIRELFYRPKNAR